MDAILNSLLAQQDLEYQAFQCRLMPTVDPRTVIGVRTPVLRKLAKAWKAVPETAAFLQALPHYYYEENNLHGLLLNELSDYEEAVDGLNRFLPFVDNWATCDLLSPRAFQRHPPQLPGQIHTWIHSGQVYTIRFGIGMLLRFYLDEAFRPDYLDWAAGACCDEYYVNMMVAWYFATALAKQYDVTLPWLQQQRLSPWVHNKTIQKAVESYRITPEQKTYLRTLRCKG